MARLDFKSRQGRIRPGRVRLPSSSAISSMITMELNDNEHSSNMSMQEGATTIRPGHKFAAILFCCSITLMLSTTDVAQSAGRDSTLIIGQVSSNPKDDYHKLKPVVDYTVSHMADLGITEGKVVMAKDNLQLVEYIREGKVDWVTQPPFSAMICMEETGAEIILRRWIEGAPDNYSIIFTHKDNKVKSLDFLKGRTIAYKDPGSTASYLAPMAELRMNGIESAPLKSVNSKPMPEKAGYVFAGSDLNIAAWVRDKKVNAGAMSNVDYINMKKSLGPWQKDMKIVYETAPFPAALEMVRRDLDPNIKRRLTQTLLGAHRDKAAGAAIAAYNSTSKFEKVDQGLKQKLDDLGQFVNLIRPEIKISRQNL